MHLAALLSLVALPFLASGLPTAEAEAAHLVSRASDAGYIYYEPGGIPDHLSHRAPLIANGGCSPNFPGQAATCTVFAGYRCRFFR